MLTIIFSPLAPDTTKPAIPSGLHLTALTSTHAALAWTANGETDLSGYYLWRGPRSGTLVKLPGLLVSPAFDDTTTAPSTNYDYAVSAVDTSNNESDPSARLQVNVPAATGSAPAVPTGLAATYSDPPPAGELDWATNPDSPDRYRVYRAIGAAAAVLIAQPAASAYIDPTPPADATLHYSVSAVSTTGLESARSAAVTLVTPAPPIGSQVQAGVERLILDPPRSDERLSGLDLLCPEGGIALLSLGLPEISFEAGAVQTNDGEVPTRRRPKNRAPSLAIRVYEPPEGEGTNWCTNPTAGRTTDGWTSIGGSVIRRVREGPGRTHGASAFELVVPGGGSVLYSEVLPGSEPWTLMLDLTIIGTPSSDLSLVVADAAGTRATLGLSALVSGETQRMTASWVSSASPGTTTFSFDSASSFTLRVDSIYIGEPTTYFDGDIAGCRWEAEPHGSRSLRPAAGGPRLEAILSDLESWVAKANTPEGCVLRRELPFDGRSITYRVVGAGMKGGEPSIAFDLYRRCDVEISLEVMPYAEMEPVTYVEHSATALALVFSEEVGGSAPALGELEVFNDSSSSWSALLWGGQFASYDEADTAELQYDAALLEPLSGASVVAYPGATGAGMVRLAVPTSVRWTPFLASDDGLNPWTHTGEYRVWVRAWAAFADIVGLRMRWAQGDATARASNEPVTLVAGFQLVDLGSVAITEEGGWRATFEALCEGQSDVAIDDVVLLPAEAAGLASAVRNFESPAELRVYEEFQHGIGAPLTGTFMGSGATWVGYAYGDSEDFVIAADDLYPQRCATRASYNDTADRGRIVYADSGLSVPYGHGALSEILLASPAFDAGGGYLRQGLIGKIRNGVDLYVRAYWQGLRLGGGPPVDSTIEGLFIDLNFGAGWQPVARVVAPIRTPDAYYGMRLVIDPDGRFSLWFWPHGFDPGEPLLSGWNIEFAPGGFFSPNSNELVGFFDECTTPATIGTRKYRSFIGAVPETDAAVPAGGSLTIAHDGVWRSSLTAAAGRTEPGRYEGDHLRIPPRGQSNRRARFIIVPMRNAPNQAGQPATIDPVRAQLTATPRAATVPR
jgi:hypothetical protein